MILKQYLALEDVEIVDGTGRRHLLRKGRGGWFAGGNVGELVRKGSLEEIQQTQGSSGPLPMPGHRRGWHG